MSVKDFNKVLTTKDMITGEITSVIDYEDYKCDTTILNTCLKNITLGEFMLLNKIYDCIHNEHGCLISISYKNK